MGLRNFDVKIHWEKSLKLSEKNILNGGNLKNDPKKERLITWAAYIDTVSLSVYLVICVLDSSTAVAPYYKSLPLI